MCDKTRHGFDLRHVRETLRKNYDPPAGFLSDAKGPSVREYKEVCDGFTTGTLNCIPHLISQSNTE